MNKYGYCKGISTRIGAAEIKGYYAYMPYSAYCFKEDYDAHPDNDREYIITWAPSDWGLPNNRKLTEIVPGSMKRYIGQDKYGNEVFEDDFVKWGVMCQGGHLRITSLMCYSDWKTQVHTSNNNNLSMWNEERNIWLDECELVEEKEN